jgi:hypothetical protein
MLGMMLGIAKTLCLAVQLVLACTMLGMLGIFLKSAYKTQK